MQTADLDESTTSSDPVPAPNHHSRSLSENSDHSVLVSVVSGDQGRSLAVLSAVTDASATAAESITRTRRWKLVNYVLIPVSLPLLALYWLSALLLGITASFMIWPSLLLAQRLYWACPFIPYIWRRWVGPWGSDSL